MRSRVRLVIVMLSLLMWGTLDSRAVADGPSVEYAVKATYLVKFAPFVEWPATAFASNAAPLVLCVVGQDPLGDLLTRAARDEHDDEHPIVVRRLPAITRDAGCHIVYAVGSGAQPTADILATLRGAAVLTVTDGTRGANDGGIIQFVIVDNRVRFAIDNAEAARAGLVISSKLLSLAVGVRPRS